MTQETLDRSRTNPSSRDVTFEDQEPVSGSAKASEGADLLHIFYILAVHRRLIFRTTSAFVILTVVIALLTPNRYTAETKLMAPQQRDTMANMLINSFSPGAGLNSLKGMSSLGFGDPNAPYIGLLQSNTIADRIIERFNLRAVYKSQLQMELRLALARATEISSAKDQGISIKVTDKDPKRAADIANAYVEEFRRLTDQLAASEAEQRHEYFERQLATAQRQLASAEEDLKETEKKTGLLDASSQAKATYEEAAALKAEIANEEATIGAMSSFETAQNRDLIIARDQVSTLRRELARLKVGGTSDSSDIMVPVGEIPDAAAEYLRKLRAVMHYEQLYKFLAIQYDAAQADEGRSAMVVQVVDPAQAPEKKSKPHRALMVIFAAFLGFSISCLAVFIRTAVENIRRDPLRAAQLDSIRSMMFRVSRGKGVFERKPSEGI